MLQQQKQIKLWHKPRPKRIQREWKTLSRKKKIDWNGKITIVHVVFNKSNDCVVFYGPGLGEGNDINESIY